MGHNRTRPHFGIAPLEQEDSPFSDDDGLLGSSFDSHESEEDLLPLLSDSQELELDGYTPLVFLDTETNGLFDEDNPLYVPEIRQICARYTKHWTFNRYVQPTADIKDEASYVNGLAIINGRLLQNGEEVLTVGLQECLQSLLLWLSEIKELAGGRKPILLAHHGFAFHFKIFCHTLEICSLHKDAYSVIGGFADTLDLARKFIPRDCVPNYKLRSLAMTFFHLSVPNEAEAQAKAVKKIFKKYLSEHFDAGEVYTFDEFCKSVI